MNHNKEQQVDLHARWEVEEASKNLVTQASILAQQHSDDLSFQSLIVWKISEIADSITRSVDEGTRTAEEAISELYNESTNFLKLHETELKSGIGIVAGGMQISAGCAFEYGTLGLGTAIAALLIGHGLNNIYEGGTYFLTDNVTDGPLRDAYQLVLGDDLGNIAYYGADLGLSGYGLMVKTPNIAKVDLKLFSFLDSEYTMAWKVMGKIPLSVEISADLATGHSTYKEVNEEEAAK